MELRHVTYFLTVVDRGGGPAAAAHLHVSPAALAAAVKALERDLGTPLFHRIGRGLVLTPAGEAFVGPARRLLRDAVAAESSLVGGDGLPRGRLDLAALTVLVTDPLARLVGAFRRRYPDVTVRITDVHDPRKVSTLIRDGHCEMAFCLLPIADRRLVSRTLGEYEQWLVLPPGATGPWGDGPVPIEAVADLPLIIVPPGSPGRALVERALTAAGVRTDPCAIIEDRDAITSFVLSGVGATIAYRPIAERAQRYGAVARPLDPPILGTHGVVYDPARLSRTGRVFLESALGP